MMAQLTKRQSKRALLTKEQLIAFEESLKVLWELGKIRVPLHLSGGNEDQLIEIFKDIKETDYVFSTHRNHYHALLHGVSDSELVCEVLADDARRHKNCGSMCTIDHPRRFYASAIVGGNCAIAVGTAYAIKQRGSKQHVWCFIGDGATDGGHFWEALRYAEGHDLPITFVIEDNDRSTCTTKDERLGEDHGNIELYLREYSDKVIYYDYSPTWPHVGSGVYVAF